MIRRAGAITKKKKKSDVIRTKENTEAVRLLDHFEAQLAEAMISKLQEPVYEILQEWGAQDITIDKDMPALIKKASKSIDSDPDPVVFATWIAINLLHIAPKEEAKLDENAPATSEE